MWCLIQGRRQRRRDSNCEHCQVTSLLIDATPQKRGTCLLPKQWFLAFFTPHNTQTTVRLHKLNGNKINTGTKVSGEHNKQKGTGARTGGPWQAGTLEEVGDAEWRSNDVILNAAQQRKNQNSDSRLHYLNCYISQWDCPYNCITVCDTRILHPRNV